MKPFKLQFFCADEQEYDGEAVSVTVPLYDGSAGILAEHSNMISTMKGGELIIDTGTEKIRYAVTEGLVEVSGGSVIILAFSAEKPEEIDEHRAREAAERARARLKKKMSSLEYQQSQAALSRALNRLKVKGR